MPHVAHGLHVDKTGILNMDTTLGHTIGQGSHEKHIHGFLVNKYRDKILKMSIKVIHSRETEIDRITQTLKKRGWYREHGYFENLYFPKGIDRNQETIPEETIRKAVEQEYDSTLYKKAEEELLKAWGEVGDFVTKTFQESNFFPCVSYDIQLTRYGTGGSYTLPNTIVLNLEKSPNLFATVLHEMVHLALEERVQKEGLSQTQKESLVEDITTRLFPEFVLKKK